MTQPEDVSAAVELGVDAIGMILHASSPRLISLDRARKVRERVPAFVSVVGVFVDAPEALIEQYSNELSLDSVQLHGNEPHQLATSLSRPYIKALRVKSADQVMNEIAQYPDAAGFLLDPYVKGQHGGTGQLLNEDCWPSSYIDKPLILAGGLGPDNVRERVTVLQPFAVDLNSGVEDAPGKKNARLLEQAIGEVVKADAITGKLRTEAAL